MCGFPAVGAIASKTDRREVGSHHVQCVYPAKLDSPGKKYHEIAAELARGFALTHLRVEEKKV